MIKKILFFIFLFFVIVLSALFFIQINTPCNCFLKEVGDSDDNKEELLKEKIGQMIMFGFRGTEIDEESRIVEVIQEVKIGGIVLFDYDIPSDSFPRNIINPEQTKSLISDLQGYSSTSLFIAVDVEGGKVNRLKEDYGFSAFLSPEELGNIGDYNFTEREALRISQELRDLGFNMNFAPVIDVNVNPDNPVIGRLGRSFSSDYQEVALHSKFFIRAHRQNNIISVVKHFPGHGSSLNDSHLGLVDVTETYKEKELFPYEFLQEESLLDAVMTAHVFNKEVDEEYPATLSPNFLEDILRERIGFKGVIISDDMQMGAIADHYGKEDSIIRAINSGCDILLFSNNGQEDYNENLPYEVQNIIYQAVIDGKISKERINDSYNRIIKLKSEFNID
jgi:beta-N-acetylhexosaminidase